jgi:hypothetical protein
MLSREEVSPLSETSCINLKVFIVDYPNKSRINSNSNIDWELGQMEKWQILEVKDFLINNLFIKVVDSITEGFPAKGDKKWDYETIFSFDNNKNQ